MTNIKISNLTHHYGAQPALKEISFQLHSGLTMLLGPNGAGKSTILNLLSGLIKTQKGSIIFDPNLKNINRMIGCVFQQPSLDPELTCRQNFNYHMALHGQTLDKNNDFRSSVGLAVDWMTVVGPLNFSLAQPITKSDGDKLESFRFNLGTTF